MMPEPVSFRFVIYFLIVSAIALGATPAYAATRHYYIAAEDVMWDFAPSGIDQMDGQVMPYPYVLHRKVMKTHYVEYTDATFTKVKPQPEWIGILGPIIRAEVGDTVFVHFRNKASGYHSIHVHGLRYDKRNEGALYTSNLPGAAVPSGGDFTYKWIADRGSAPPAGQSSRLWLYHGHVDEPRETNNGLIGPVIVTAKGQAKPDGSPKDVQREFIALFMIFDQLNGSEDGLFHSINGYVFGNLPGLIMNEGEKVRWYLAAMGSESDVHSAHWHGETVIHRGHSEDVIPLMPAQTETVDMLADNPGTWMFQCHVADHIEAGMMAFYRIRPAHPRSCPVQFGEGNFFAPSGDFHLNVKNSSNKPISGIFLATDLVTGLNHLTNLSESWKIPLPIAAGANAELTMPNHLGSPEQVQAWVLFPVTITFADGTKWSPEEYGECRKDYWRSKDHQNMEILPPHEMH